MINGSLQKILIGGGVSAAIGITSFMGYGIVNNDVRNTTQHIDIRREAIEADKEIDHSIDKVKEIVTDIRIEQSEQRVILHTIAEKL